ncbi:MAG: hypothetical protein C0469_16685 [Cyanobacteria bacterium DS2.3.42]|nr:hypothetical protein [Cyanobacteria bacterium DS2.3.42]
MVIVRDPRAKGDSGVAAAVVSDHECTIAVQACAIGSELVAKLCRQIKSLRYGIKRAATTCRKD